MKKELRIETIEKMMQDSDFDVRQAALAACKGRDVPLDIIQVGLNDSDWRVRKAALEACKGRDVPLDIIQVGLNDSDFYVRQAELKLCKSNGIDIPVIRTFDPPELVYKKCLNGVIVVAHIPDDAQVRGNIDSKCRASKAIIREIIGDVCGEPVGISLHDKKTLYYAGDEIVIEDFDYSNKECSTGFHFFCSIEQARNY